MPNTRQMNFIGLAVILTAIISSYALEFMGYEPCVLCLVQRYCLWGVGVLFLAAAIHYKNTLWQRRYWVMSFFVTLIGLSAVGRQLYLQHMPKSEDALCLPGAGFFWEMGNYTQAFKALIIGSQDCREVGQTILGLSFAAWSGIFLVGVLALIAYGFYVVRQEQPSRL